MKSRYRTMEGLFRAFQKDSKGKYIREEVQTMWEGWQLRERTADQTSDG